MKIEQQEKCDYLTTAQHKDTKMYHGILMHYHPTPSGCERWFIGKSTNEGFKKEEDALECIKKAFPDLPYCVNGKLISQLQKAAKQQVMDRMEVCK